MPDTLQPLGWQEFAASYNDGRYSTNPVVMQHFSFYRRLMDVCGEVERAMRAWAAWDEDPTAALRASLERQLEAVDRICYRIYNDDAIPDTRKRTLRIAEWELWDFCLWGNKFHNTADTATRWFDQWRHDYNTELLVERIAL